MKQKSGELKGHREEIYSVSLSKNKVGLPTFMTLEQTSKSLEPWGPVISNRKLDHSEIIYIMGGVGKIAVANRWYDCRMHQAFFIPSGTSLSISTSETNKLDLLYSHFHFEGDHSFVRLNGTADYILYELHSLDEAVYPNLLVLPDQILLYPDNPILGYLKAARDVYEEKNYGFYQEACLLLMGAVHQLSKIAIARLSQPVSNKRGKPFALAEQMRSYISNHIETFTGMGELESSLNMNGIYLSRVFKSAFGENIVFYVNSLRIELAKKYLTTTDTNIPELAKKSGFNDTSHFRRVFKDFVGVSPLEFRRLHMLEPTPAIKFHTPFEPPKENHQKP